eukprot:6191116-Pleurochrysis_carterae.AAC.3
MSCFLAVRCQMRLPAGLAVKRFEKFPDDGYTSIIKVSLAGRQANVHFSIVTFEQTLEVCDIYVELPNAQNR